MQVRLNAPTRPCLCVFTRSPLWYCLLPAACKQLQEAIVKIYRMVERILLDALVFSVGANVIAIDCFAGNSISGQTCSVGVNAVGCTICHIGDHRQSWPHFSDNLLQRREHVRAERWRSKTLSIRALAG